MVESGAENKIYVGSLSFDTDKDTLERHFLRYGDIADCIVMTDKEMGKSRGFGFVTFRDISSVHAALEAPASSHVLDGREITVKKAVRESPPPKTPMPSGEGNFNVKKIFVGGLPSSCDNDKLHAHFMPYGQIEEAIVMMDSQTQRPRGFGYVSFYENSSVEAAMAQYSEHKIDSKWIEVKRCIPQDVMRASGQAGGGGSRGAPRAGTGVASSAYGYPAGYGPYAMGAAGYYGYPYGAMAYQQMAAGGGYGYGAAGYGCPAAGYGYAAANYAAANAYGPYGAAPAGYGAACQGTSYGAAGQIADGGTPAAGSSTADNRARPY